LAEEVFAHTAELSFKDIGIFESVPEPKVKTKEDILDLVNALKNGIHHGVLKQKIFPKENHLQFSKTNNKTSHNEIKRNQVLEQLNKQATNTKQAGKER